MNRVEASGLVRSQKVAAAPYLSLVVTARNDDHGGNLLARMQAFVNGWLNQARSNKLASELIIVEWNPPPDRPRLAQALHWPQAPGPCSVRIIQVSPELHRRYLYGTDLPLYQMIGKNVGIRRARGKFVLATNIDILFSSELVAFLARNHLDPGRMYRIDRHDTVGGVPVDGDPEEQLAYCRAHVIRINQREGTFAVSEDGPGAVSILSPGVGISLRRGWFPPERHGRQELFQWGSARAELSVEAPPSGAHALVVELEPGPGTGGAPLDLEIGAGTRSIARFQISRRTRLRVQMPWSPGTALVFTVHGELVAAGIDPRRLPFRIFRIAWEPAHGRRLGLPSASISPINPFRRAAVFWRAMTHALARLASEGPLLTFTVLVSPGLQRFLRRLGRRRLAHSSVPLPAGDGAPLFLHVNACGDFTLLARDRWADLRGYPEFDLFSMNLDSVLCYAAHHGGSPEEVLSEPLRIYHIEHASGSGWTPEGQSKLFQRLAGKGIPFIASDTVLNWGAQMRRLNSPMIFNHEDWGLAAFDLPEEVPVASAPLPGADG